MRYSRRYTQLSRFERLEYHRAATRRWKQLHADAVRQHAREYYARHRDRIRCRRAEIAAAEAPAVALLRLPRVAPSGVLVK